MPQLFHPRFNALAKSSVFGFVFACAGIVWILADFQRSPYLTNQGLMIDQPVPFSHEHHVSGLGIDCRYCHVTVETSSYAGMPSTKTCMTCHSQIWTQAAMLEPVRESWREGQPIIWKRVNVLPDFVFFNHSAHIQKGVGCSTCHGRVDRMPLTMEVASLQMEWCLTCHREPERFLRPREEVFNMNYIPPPDQLKLGRELRKRYHVLPAQLMQNCSLCHR